MKKANIILTVFLATLLTTFTIILLLSFKTPQQTDFNTKELQIIHSALCKYSVYINTEHKANRKTRFTQQEIDSLIAKTKDILHN